MSRIISLYTNVPICTSRRIVDGKKYKIPSTIDDPTVLKKIEEAVRTVR
jgi:hypothetical protein